MHPYCPLAVLCPEGELWVFLRFVSLTLLPKSVPLASPGHLGFCLLNSEVLSSIQGLGVFQMPPLPVPVVVSVFHQSGFKEEDGDLGQTGEASLPFRREQLCQDGRAASSRVRSSAGVTEAGKHRTSCAPPRSRLRTSQVPLVTRGKQRRSALIGQLAQTLRLDPLQTNRT